MRPTSAQILRAVVTNLEELVLPQLQGPHARSAAANAVMLLEHVILRLESEGEALGADNGEKRNLLGSLDEVPASLHDGAREVMQRLADTPETGGYASIESLTEENERLKSILDDWLTAIHAADDLAEEETRRLRAPIRAQLRAQVDREARLVVPIALDRIFRDDSA